MERWLTQVGLALCGLVIVTTALLLGIRLVAGPRTLDSSPCASGAADTTCVHDHYTGSVVGRSWLIVAVTLSVCAGAVGMSLLAHRRSLTSA